MWYQSPLIGPMGQGPPELHSVMATQFLVPPGFGPMRMTVLDGSSPQPTGMYNGFSPYSHSYTPHFPPPQFYPPPLPPPPPSPVLQFPQLYSQMATMADSNYSVSQIHSPTPHTYNQSYPSHQLHHQFTPRHYISPIYPSNSPERFSLPSAHFVPIKTTITPPIHQFVSLSQHNPPLGSVKLEEPFNSHTPSLTELSLEPNFIVNGSPKQKLKSARVKGKFKVMSHIMMKREHRLGFNSRKQLQLSPIFNSFMELSVYGDNLSSSASLGKLNLSDDVATEVKQDLGLSATTSISVHQSKLLDKTRKVRHRGQYSEPEIVIASSPCVEEACFQLEEQGDNGWVDGKVVGLPLGYGQLDMLSNINSEFYAGKLFDKRSQLEGLFSERMMADYVVDWLLSKVLTPLSFNFQKWYPMLLWLLRDMIECRNVPYITAFNYLLNDKRKWVEWYPDDKNDHEISSLASSLLVKFQLFTMSISSESILLHGVILATVLEQMKIVRVLLTQLGEAYSKFMMSNIKSFKWCTGYVLQSGIGSWDSAIVSCKEYLRKSSFWDEISKDSSKIIGIVNLVLASAPKFPSEYELQRMWYCEKNIGLLKINRILHSWYFPILDLSIIVIDVESIMVSHFHKYELNNAWLELLRHTLKAVVSAFHHPDCTSVFVQDIDAFAPYGPRHIECNTFDPIDDYLKQYLLKHDVKIFQNMTMGDFKSGKEPKCKLKMFFDSWEITYVSRSIEEVTLFNLLITSWSLKVLKLEYQSISVQKSRFFQDYKTENERAIVRFGVVETLPSFNEDGVLSLYGFSVWSLELLYESRNMGKESVTQLFGYAMVPYIPWGPKKVNINTPREILIKFLGIIQPPISSKLIAFQNSLVCFQVNWYNPQYWKKCGYISLDFVASETHIELMVPNLVLEVILSKNMTLQLVLAEKTIIGILRKPTPFYISSLALDLVIDSYRREWRWITWLLKIMKKNLARQKLIWPFERIITCWHEGIISALESYKQGGCCYFYASEYVWLQRYLQSIIHEGTTSAALFSFVFVKCDSFLDQSEHFFKSPGEFGSLIVWNNWQESQVVHGIAALKIILVHVATALDDTFIAIFGMSLSLTLEVKL